MYEGYIICSEMDSLVFSWYTESHNRKSNSWRQTVTGSSTSDVRQRSCVDSEWNEFAEWRGHSEGRSADEYGPTHHRHWSLGRQGVMAPNHATTCWCELNWMRWQSVWVVTHCAGNVVELAPATDETFTTDCSGRRLTKVMLSTPLQ